MSEELTEAQIEELRQRLLTLQQDLELLLKADEEGARPVDLGAPIGRLSRMDALQQQSMAKASRRSNEIRRQQVKAALDAIRQGEYGLCRECEEPISYGRLAARPESPFCRDCQQGRESQR